MITTSLFKLKLSSSRQAVLAIMDRMKMLIRNNETKLQEILFLGLRNMVVYD